MAANLPSGTVTFLFTDIEGSTKLAQQRRGSWERLRDRHAEILREAIKAHHGYLFEIVGDSFCVAFHKPGDALLAALAGQRGLNAEPWGDTPLRVRMGINTGVAEPDEHHYRGYMALSSVARIMRLLRAQVPGSCSRPDKRSLRYLSLYLPQPGIYFPCLP